jgi:hypothetical protein
MEFVRDRDVARKFKTREETEQVVATFVVGACTLTVEPE